MKLTDLASVKLTTLKGLWTVRQKDTVLYLSECDLAADVVDVSNEHANWLVYPDQVAATGVVAEIAALETTAKTTDEGYSVTEYEAVPLEQVAELEYDLTTKGVLTHRVVKLGQGNGPLKAFLKKTLKDLKASRKRCDKDIAAHGRALTASLKDCERDYMDARRDATNEHVALCKEASVNARLDDKLIERAEHLLSPPALKSRARNPGQRPHARSMTQKKAAAKRGATGARKAKGGKSRRRKWRGNT